MSIKIDKTKYFGSKEASQLLGVHPRTLYLWEEKGIIETIRSSERGKRFYNVGKYFLDKGIKCEKINNLIKCSSIEDMKKEKKIKICYARVSSNGQKGDLERQKAVMKDKYPEYHLIEDIGSGINLTKKGIKIIIDLAIEGKIQELIIVHKDRLARFGYDLMLGFAKKYMITKYSNGKIIIMEENKNMEPEEEMVNDVLQIMNVFVAKINGRRKYKRTNK
jgi:predicted site-specific integrase-resolvase